MKIENKTLKIECNTPSLSFFEDYFKKNGYEVIRYALVALENNIATVDCAIVNKGEIPRLVNKFLHNLF